jgi:RNA polymerase sigma-70 factor (ECF subfamily)
VLGCPEAAGDAVQDGLLRAWKSVGQLREPTAWQGWLLRSVKHAAIDATRRRGRLKLFGDDLPDVPTAAAEVGMDERRDAVRAALAKLDPDTRSAVVLRYFDDADSAAIGEVLALSPGAVDMRLSRARKLLRGLLKTWREVT